LRFTEYARRHYDYISMLRSEYSKEIHKLTMPLIKRRELNNNLIDLTIPYYIGSPTIETGNRFIDLISELIPELYTEKVLIVEGDCEEIIFKKLFMKPKYSHPKYNRIENMKGEGNFRRIELFLKELRRKHCKIHIVADGDSQMANIIQRLRNKALIEGYEYTIFSKAIEDAFPHDMVIHFFKRAMPA